MTIKSLKKLTGLLNRSEGLSLTPIIVMMVIMSVMGAVFTSIMGGWKISAPMTINSKKANYLAETAATFALQDASFRFFSKDASGCPDFPGCPDSTAFPGNGTRSTPYIVSSSSTESAEYWIERPYPSANTSVDEYPTSTHRGNNDDDITGVDDDVMDDDTDDANPTLYTIIATGKVIRNGTTVATRQIKVKADIIRSLATEVAPGVQTSGDISGTGGGFGMQHNANTTEFMVGSNNDNPPGSEAGIVIRPAQQMDENYVKAMAISQGHYNEFALVVNNANDDYPEPGNPSFYFNAPTDTFPNFTYVGTDFTVLSNRKAHGVIWVKGNTVLDGTATMDAVLICEGDVTFNGNTNIVGGIIHYGTTINGNGNPNAITVNDAFFDALSLSIPIVTVQSWQEAVSAN